MVSWRVFKPNKPGRKKYDEIKSSYTELKGDFELAER
jgi:hypothetical protein